MKTEEVTLYWPLGSGHALLKNLVYRSALMEPEKLFSLNEEKTLQNLGIPGIKIM